MSLLRLDKVSLNFGTHILLDEVDFQIAKGQRIGLLGRNGAVADIVVEGGGISRAHCALVNSSSGTFLSTRM